MRTRVKSYVLQKQGERGAIVTIPRYWIENNGLGCGDTINMYIRDDQVIEIEKGDNDGK